MIQLKKINVAMLPTLVANSGINAEQGAIVIDTLRFTTTAAQAIHSGAQTIRVAQEISAARDLAARSGSQTKLCGERECRPIEGFHLGNSPLEYTSIAVKDQDLIFSTTNGTLAVESTQQFGVCLLAALVNRTSVARAIQRSRYAQWQIVCAGTDGQIAGEDLLAAGAIIEVLLANNGAQLCNDSAHLALLLWQTARSSGVDSLEKSLKSFCGGRNLVDAGFESDIQFASQVDLLDAVPVREMRQSIFCKLELATS